ncbi:MAG: hypothetical protein IT221_03495 [Fluviicola sp.]|nr:hypothetical protein [Fluviicola sp.]
MKKWISILSVLLCILSSCLVEQAPVAKDHQLIVFSDKLTAQDSIFLKQYAKQHKIDLTFHQLNADFIKQQILQHRYDIDVDVLWLSDQALRDELQQQQLLRSITNDQLFTDLNRQFNNTHHCWLPLAHNPLVLAMPKDSSNWCRTIYFEAWHKKDSLKPQFKLGQWESLYLKELQKSKRFEKISRTSNKNKLANERVYPLSYLVKLEEKKDSSYQRSMNACKTYLLDRKRYITIFSSASIYRYGRNPAEAERFMSALSNYSSIFASSRDQLPCSRKTRQSPKIGNLQIK